ncbi:MAG: hypothetical protein K2Y27_30180 [Xanthobacteraceae bacterium]|nr:hypothetical protein [Xanthobacteraceae bacterium]
MLDDARVSKLSVGRGCLVAALLILLGAGVYVGYHFIFPEYTNRFRLVIEVETPEGLKSGSSVIQTSFWESGGWGPVEARGVRGEAKGEAVFVDLGKGQFVIGILGWGAKGQDQDKIFGLTRAALARGKKVAWRDEYKLKGRGDLPQEYVPTFVTFSDRKLPVTVSVVERDDFERAFRPGVRFRRAFLETTDAPISRTLAAKLPWLPHPTYLSGRGACFPSEAHCLHGGNFTK